MTPAPWAALDLAATAVALAAMVTLHVLPTGLAPAHQAVSEYGIGRYRGGYRVLTVSLGIAGLATAVGVAAGYPPAGRSTIVGLLVIFGLCRLAISWWPMDPPGAPRSSRGTVHLVLATGAFLSATVAADRLRRTGPRHTASTLSGYHAVTAVAFALMVLGIVGLVLTRRLGTEHRFFGAAERLIYLGIYALLTATGIGLL